MKKPRGKALYTDYLYKRLKDMTYARIYLQTVLKNEDDDCLLLACHDILEAQTKNPFWRYTFDEIFKRVAWNIRTPRFPVKINGILFEKDEHISPGLTKAGINLFIYQNYDVAVEKIDDCLILKGFYDPETQNLTKNENQE